MEDVGFLTPEEMAKKMKVTRPTIYEWIRQGKIKAIKTSSGVRGAWRIPETEVKRLHALAYEVKIEAE